MIINSSVEKKKKAKFYYKKCETLIVQRIHEDKMYLENDSHFSVNWKLIVIKKERVIIISSQNEFNN